MIRIKPLISTVIFLFCAISVAGAQNHVMRDTSGIDIRRPPADIVADYSEDAAFQYEAPAQQSNSLLFLFFSWLEQLLDELLENNTTKSILEVLLYLAFGVLVVLLLNQFIQGDVSGIFRPESSPPPDFNPEEKSNANTDIEPMIRRAVEQKQYNLAIRLLYQQCLARLHEHGRISWQRNKTNRDYINEIKQQDLRQVFCELTRYYEYAQYGNFHIGDVSFQKAYRQFRQMESVVDSLS